MHSDKWDTHCNIWAVRSVNSICTSAANEGQRGIQSLKRKRLSGAYSCVVLRWQAFDRESYDGFVIVRNCWWVQRSGEPTQSSRNTNWSVSVVICFMHISWRGGN